MDKLRVIFLGGRQAGLIGLLATIAAGCCIKAVVPASSKSDVFIGNAVHESAKRLNVPIYHSVKQLEIWDILAEVDLLISVHSREIIPMDILSVPRFGGINVHPCLYKYKGKDPIQRFLKDGESRASVGVHWMTAEVDMGGTINEMFVEVDRSQINTIIEVYNILYPLYVLVLWDALRRLQSE